MWVEPARQKVPATVGNQCFTCGATQADCLHPHLPFICSGAAAAERGASRALFIMNELGPIHFHDVKLHCQSGDLLMRLP